MLDKLAQFPHFRFRTNENSKMFVIAGPCVVESEELCKTIASRLAELSNKFEIDILFKASYDKANRTSQSSFRGPGKEEGLAILKNIGKEFGLCTVTDIHESIDAASAAEAVDVLQIPAFLCRQTDLLISAGKTGKWVNIKKGQFMSPSDMQYSIEKAGKNTWLTERGTFFGYNRLVVDLAGIPAMKSFGCPVILDATHSVQQPGGGQGCSSGNRDLAIPYAKAAICMGCDGLFFEVHPDPEKALCDGPNSVYLDEFERQLPRLIELYELNRKR